MDHFDHCIRSYMEIITFRPLGVQKVTNPDGNFDYQLRSICLVRPMGKFESDPDGSIEKIELVDPEKYKDYFDWGKIGDRMMKWVIELLPILNKNF